MTDAPERIWVWPDYNDHCIPFKQDWTHGFWDSTEDSLGTEYVRVDRIAAKAAEIERLRGAMQEAIRLAEQPHYGDMSDALDQWSDAIKVLRTTLAELTGGKA